nr:MAG TPA: hypothetical protein [Caudoviricetes sp.]
MAQWINDPQNREEIEKVTNEMKLPIYKASAKGKFRVWLSETWEKLEDYILKLKSIVDKKEDYISKKSGFNLDKTDDFNDNDTNKLATSKAVNGVYKSSVQRNGGQDFWLHKSSDGHIYVYFQKNNVFNLKLADSEEVTSKKITVSGNDVWHTGNFDPNTKIDMFGGYKFKGFHYNSEGDLYYFINDTEHRKIIDNRGGDVEKLSVGGNNVWHTGNFDPSIKINKFGGLDFKGFHYNSESDLYYFIDDKNSRRLIDNRGGDVEKLSVNGAKVYHTENFIRHIWNGAYLASLNETSPFCNLPADWRICIIGYQWVSGSNLGSTFATAVILRNHVPLNRWFLAHSGNPNNQPNLMWGEARFMITSSNGLISQGQNTYGGDCYVLTVDVI